MLSINLKTLMRDYSPELGRPAAPQKFKCISYLTVYSLLLPCDYCLVLMPMVIVIGLAKLLQLRDAIRVINTPIPLRP